MLYYITDVVQQSYNREKGDPMKFATILFALFALTISAWAQTPDDNPMINAYRHSNGLPDDNFMRNGYERYPSRLPDDNFVTHMMSPPRSDYRSNFDFNPPSYRNRGIYDNPDND